MPLNPLQHAAPRNPGAFDPTLPQPYETSRRRSNRRIFTPQLADPERQSYRTTLVRKPEDRASEATVLPQVRVAPKEIYSSTGPSERKSLASSIFFPKAADTKIQTSVQDATTNAISQQPTDYFTTKELPSNSPLATVPQKTEFLPQPIESTRRTNRKPSPLNTTARAPSDDLPPSPPRFVPVPVETTYRTNRPLARPLVTQPAEEAPKTNIHRKLDMRIDLSNLPQPISTTRWTNRIRPGQRHLRRSSTVQPPGTPGVYYFVPATGQSSAAPLNKIRGPGKWVKPADHVSHLHEPVDSAPPSPAGSPGSSRCPSLSSSPTTTSSPTNSTTSSSWEVNKQLGFRGKGGIGGRRESFDEGYSNYISEVERRARDRTSGSSASSEDSTNGGGRLKPQVVEKHRRESETDGSGHNSEIKYMRAKARGETLKPPKIQIPQPTTQQVYDEYPIYASPTRERFLPSPQRVPTPELRAPPANARAKLAASPPATPHQAYGPPPNQPAVLTLGGLKIPVLRVMYSNPIAPSPGITVASLPPRPITKKKTAGVPEEVDDVTDDFVKEVWNYLSFDHECIAKKYDEELAEYTGTPLDAVRKDRFAALREYVKAWVGQNPTVEGGEHLKGGLW